GIHRIAAESIDCFSWKRDKASCFDDSSCQPDGCRIRCREDGTGHMIGLPIHRTIAITPEQLFLHRHRHGDRVKWVVPFVALDPDNLVDHLDPPEDFPKYGIPP